MIDLFSEQHDFFLSALLNGLEVYNGQSPPFGATVFFELREHNRTAPAWDEAHSIGIFYLNETQSNAPHPLRIPACSTVDHCTIKQFASAVSDLVLTRAQWAKECNGQGHSSDYNPLLGRTYNFNKGDLIKGVCLIVVATLAVVFAVLITVIYLKERRHNNRAFKQKLLN